MNYTLLQRHGTMMILIYIYINKTDKSLLTVLVSRVVNHDLQYLNFRNKNGIPFSTNFLPFH